MARYIVSNTRRYIWLASLFVFGILLLFLREESFIIAVLDHQSGVVDVFTGNRYDALQTSQNIFFDDDAFSQLLTYSTAISNKSHPSNWLELNDQLFCPILNSRTLNPGLSVSNGDENLLKMLYDLQFKDDCFSDDENNKFLVFDIQTAYTRGLGAVVQAALIRFLYRAIYTNRTLLVTGKWSWSSEQSFCANKPGMECYVLPPSNCDYDAVLTHFGTHQEWQGGIPSHCDIGGDNRSLPLCEERIVTVNKRYDGWGYFPRPSVIDKYLLYRYRFNYNVFRAVATSFMLRLNPQVRSIVYSKVRDSWTSSLSHLNDGDAVNDEAAVINPLSTLSLPIRNSDKCRIEGHVGGEMECWTIKEYIAFLQSVSVLSQHRIDTVIITSESTEFVRNLSDRIRTEMNGEWRVIVNREDVSSQIGAADYIEHPERYREWIQYSDRRLNTELKYDPIVGALSSMLLQVSTAKYMVFTKSSNWLDLMYAVAKQLDCNALFWSGQFQVNWNGKHDNVLDGDDDDDDVIHNDGHGEKPAFMQNTHSLNLHIDKKCFEFNQWGLANKRTFRKSISFPPDLWEVLKTEPDHEFGIRAKEHRPCTRYHINPFERSDTLY